MPAQVRLLADLYRGWENRPQPPMPTYPDAGGLIPWADNEGHAALCWLPDSDDPNTWPVFATREENTYERIPGGAVEALIAVLRGDAGRSVFEAPFYENLDLFGAFTFDGDEGPSGDVDLPTPEPLDQPAG